MAKPTKAIMAARMARKKGYTKPTSLKTTSDLAIALNRPILGSQPNPPKVRPTILVRSSGGRTRGIKEQVSISKRVIQRPVLATTSSNTTYVSRDPSIALKGSRVPLGKRMRAKYRFNKATRRLASNPHAYGTVESLRQQLGLIDRLSSPDLLGDAVFVAIDTETEKHYLNECVVEIGVTTLDTRDLRGAVEPGSPANDFVAKAKTQHVVVDTTRKPTTRMRSCLFSKSLFYSAPEANRWLRQVLTKAAYPVDEHDGHSRRKLILVGQSIGGDVVNLIRCKHMDFNIYDAEQSGVNIDQVFDTAILADTALRHGAPLRSRKLGDLVAALATSAELPFMNLNTSTRRLSKQALLGQHNAGNDAHYTMMALLLFAVRWPEIARNRMVHNSEPPSTRSSGDSLLRHAAVPNIERSPTRVLKDSGKWSLVEQLMPKNSNVRSRRTSRKVPKHSNKRWVGWIILASASSWYILQST